MEPNRITDRLPGIIRFYLTGTYLTSKEKEEFDNLHVAGYYLIKIEDGTYYLDRGDGFAQRWTAHGWCSECDKLLPPDLKLNSDGHVSQLAEETVLETV